MSPQTLYLILCISLSITLALPSEVCLSAQPGETADVVPFGELKKWNAEGKDYGVFWEDSRDIFKVVIKFADPNTLPENVRLEYWQSTWPRHRIPRDKPSGAGSSGWLNVGDWLQGKWLKADTNLQVNGSTYTFTFNPLSAKEFTDMKDFPVTYRSTLKLRVISDKSLPQIDSFVAYTDSAWEKLAFEVEWRAASKDQQQSWDGKLEVFNGILQQLQPISTTTEGKVAPDYFFKLQKNSLQQLYLMLKDPSAKASGASAGLEVFMKLEAKEIIRESLLNPRKNVVGWDLVIIAAKATKNTNDEKALPNLIYVLSQNNYPQQGSEDATIHQIMKRNLVEAIQEITHLDIKVSEININSTKDVERVLSMARAWRGKEGEKPQYVQMRDVNDLELSWDKLTAKLNTNPDLWTEVENILKRDAPDSTWTSKVKDQTDGIRTDILYAKTNAYNSFDETIVTVRTACETFSFAASDLIKQGHIFIPDFGVIIRKAGDNTTYKLARQAWESNKNKNIYTAVSTMPEQTLTRAWSDMPQKEPFYIPISFEGSRQHFGVEPDGSIFCHSYWLSRIQGKDTKRCLYEGDSINYRFGLDNAKLIERGIVDGCLPMITASWQRDGVRYHQTAFVIPFDGMPKGDGRVYADDTLVLMCRFEISAADKTECQAKLDIKVEDEPLTLNNGMIFVTGAEPRRLRLFVASKDPADSFSLQAQDKNIAYRADLTPGKSKRVIDIAIPYVTLTDDKEWQKLRTIRFDNAFDAVRKYWQSRIEEGAQIITPEPMVNDFYKAHISHLLLNTEREVGDSDRYMAKVGTFRYGVFSNESCMMISDLDRRGYHKRAEQALETWLHYQGTVALPGDYSTKEGQLYGAGGYEDGGYNQHHGFILWCLGEHYWYTRDIDWLKRAAPKIVKGCEWIINQRQRTIPEAQKSPIRAIEKGLLPPGSLEDIGDWRSWMSTNVYSWWGMNNAAAALNDAGIPDGKRLLEEAAAYRKDILNNFTEAMQRSPVVRLRDDSWIPHIPPEVHRRGRTFGWITETLEGPIHLIATGIIDPCDRLATWIMKDYEDNLCISEQYGFNLKGEEFDRYWFSRGAVSIQPNLLWMVPYLLRDQPEHFLRTYFNGFAMCYFPDTRMLTEWVRKLGVRAGDHYKSSDEANSTYWLRLMFVEERGEELWLGAAVPRYWLSDGNRIGIENARTYFGPMSVKWESKVSKGRIEVTLDPPKRNPPKKIYVRFRHPEGKHIVRCEVDGKAHSQFDPEKEWIVFDKCPQKTTRIIAYYD